MLHLSGWNSYSINEKLSYGYVEAAHYWWKDLSGTFTGSGCTVSHKDTCVFMKCKADKVAFFGTTIEEFLFVCTRDDAGIQKQIQMLEKKY